MKVCSKCGGKHYGKGLCQKHYDAAKYVKNKVVILARHKKFVAKNPGYYKKDYAKNIEKRKASQKKYRATNKDRVKILERESRERNKEQRLSAMRVYRDKNREAMRIMWREYHGKNLGKHRVNMANRKAMKLQAVPKWIEPEFERFVLEEMHDLAARRTVSTKIPWHVDHTVPLRSKTVCGLHWSANWQVIPAIENHVKGNRFWPDMPQ